MIANVEKVAYKRLRKIYYCVSENGCQFAAVQIRVPTYVKYTKITQRPMT